MRRVRLDDERFVARHRRKRGNVFERGGLGVLFFSSGDADREGTHRLRDEEREDAGDGSAVSTQVGEPEDVRRCAIRILDWT